MENIKKKCAFKEHKDTDADNYCIECKICMCNKCSIYHSGLLENHHQYNLKEIKDKFVDVCKEENHSNKLELYCKNHNQLCCIGCVTKIKGHGYGQHFNCDICFIEDIKEEKKNQLKENIKTLEKLSKTFEKKIEELTEIFEKINKDKEDLKTTIQKTFTKLRNALNDREDELLLKVENYFDNLIFNESTIKKYKKLPNKINASLEEGKKIEKNLEDYNVIQIINDCINIENSIKDINMMNEKIKEYKMNNDIKINFSSDEELINTYIEKLKNFGWLFYLYSLILKTDEDYIKFNKLISAKENLNNAKLIYRSSVDGFNFNSIINKINNKSNLLFLYHTENNRIFGAVIKCKLDNLNGSR